MRCWTVVRWCPRGYLGVLFTIVLKSEAMGGERGFNFFRDEATNTEKDMIAQWLRTPAAVYDGILKQNGDLTVFAMWKHIGYKEDKI
ncbi:hypothetical protein JG688_00003333 [Phytophthora aleatoria]|uniref:RxLR effector protein n=1 Tax=Phytophthora aleatoria TaxID=2496075 RepID=A0A8J5J353_9STRA|nr:hypothetical protein JG688_00003333 [Phytophthora aleatoria]